MKVKQEHPLGGDGKGEKSKKRGLYLKERGDDRYALGGGNLLQRSRCSHGGGESQASESPAWIEKEKKGRSDMNQGGRSLR